MSEPSPFAKQFNDHLNAIAIEAIRLTPFTTWSRIRSQINTHDADLRLVEDLACELAHSTTRIVLQPQPMPVYLVFEP
jgi:hypothetical protein